VVVIVIGDDVFQYGEISSTEELGKATSYPQLVSAVAGVDSTFDALSFETLWN
jgi:hypothetical protein